ncbi:MAG TPA: MptD family putative ECF transporter S component [Candidatus Borkfalkia avistercoris]|uniref:MptD family putative ECF transporter S component n=2 Tax=Clostridia TaxID=186801 RepID=A0A9D2CZP2_9FIRM|nr:MptD family putative ECF transporter S component [Candidatus Borkfalkia avistercoris]
MNQEEKKVEEQAVQALIANTEEIVAAAPAEEKENGPVKQEADGENKIFRKYKIKDIVFLAIMAACMLVTGAIMPLVGQIPVFGIIQVCLGLQFSIFPVIGMMKVRKPGALLFMSLCCGVVLVFMNTVMFVCILLCAVIAEGLVLLIFRGYQKDGACLFAGTIYFPVTLPFLYIYYRFLYSWTGKEGQAVNAFIGSSAGMAVGMSIAVLAICFVGALIGVIISRELKKSGVMKK